MIKHILILLSIVLSSCVSDNADKKLINIGEFRAHVLFDDAPFNKTMDIYHFVSNYKIYSYKKISPTEFIFTSGMDSSLFTDNIKNEYSIEEVTFGSYYKK